MYNYLNSSKDNQANPKSRSMSFIKACWGVVSRECTKLHGFSKAIFGVAAFGQTLDLAEYVCLGKRFSIKTAMIGWGLVALIMGTNVAINHLKARRNTADKNQNAPLPKPMP